MGISKIKIDPEQVQRLLADALTYARVDQQQEADVSADAVPATEHPSTSTSGTVAALPQTEEILADVLKETVPQELLTKVIFGRTY